MRRGEAEKKNGDVVVVECSLSFCCAPPREVSHTCAVIIQHGSNGNIKWQQQHQQQQQLRQQQQQHVAVVSCQLASSAAARNRDKVLPLLGANEENAIVENLSARKTIAQSMLLLLLLRLLLLLLWLMLLLSTVTLVACCCRENVWRTFCNQSMCSCCAAFPLLLLLQKRLENCFGQHVSRRNKSLTSFHLNKHHM